MDRGLATTLKILRETRNESAADVLIDALDSPDAEIAQGAFETLCSRRTASGHRELIRRWGEFSDTWRELLGRHAARLSNALRDAILEPDARMCRNGCEAAVWLREFDLIPPLVSACEDKANPHRELAGQTLRGLAESLYAELSTPRDYQNRRDPQLVRQHVLTSLEGSLLRYETHRRAEPLEAMLMLSNRDSSALKNVLANPHHPAYLTLIQTLTESPQPGVMRLLLSYLDDPRAPSSAINALAHRSDLPFLAHLLNKVGFEPSANARVNLRRLTKIPWIRERPELLPELNDAQQHAAVQLAICSGVHRLEVFEFVRYAIEHGGRGGRRAAADALAEFKGVEANQLAVQCLDDKDPQVQASAVSQIRDRGIPGAMSHLVDRVQHAHPLVRQAARNGLSEFTFPKYAAAFDTMTDEARRSSGQLVRKVDPAAIAHLQSELEAAGRSRRIRGLRMTAAMGCVGELESCVIAGLDDADHFVRVEAALALARVRSSQSQSALRKALGDRSVSVREAAAESLRQQGKAVPIVAAPAANPDAPIQLPPSAGEIPS